MRDELADVLRRVFADHAHGPETETFPAALWATLDDLGMTRLTLPEHAGGSGGDLLHAAALLLAAGEATAAVPLAETDLTAGWLLHTAGLEVPPTVPLAVAAEREGGLTVLGEPGGWRLSGRLSRVGWARHAGRVAVLARGPEGGDLVLSLDPRTAGLALVEGVNLAGEPRDDLVLDVHVPAGQAAEVTTRTRTLLARRAALARALLLTGAADRALRQSVGYAEQRVQFGRPIGRFQAVQQQLALAAADVSSARATAEAAVRIAADEDFAGDRAGLAVAVAKARASGIAGAVARIAHQVHGALGFTREHSLRRATTRLWAWRDEDGDETVWNAEVARQALAAGGDGLWALITAAS